MVEIFGTSNENGTEIIIYRGQGTITSLAKSSNGAAVHVFIQDTESGMPLEGWLREEDPIVELVKASKVEKSDITYRIEKIAKNPDTQDITDLIMNNKHDQIKSYFSAINGQSSPTSLSDIADDDDAYETNPFELEELHKKVISPPQPAPREGAMYELYNSEGGVNYASAGFMGAVSFETFSRERLLRHGVISAKDVFQPEAEMLVRKHMSELMRISNRIQLTLVDNRPGAKVNICSSTHTRIRGMIFSTLDLGVNLDEEKYNPYNLLMDNEGEILDEVSNRLEDIVYSRMFHTGELAVNIDLMNPEKLFPSDDENQNN